MRLSAILAIALFALPASAADTIADQAQSAFATFAPVVKSSTFVAACACAAAWGATMLASGSAAAANAAWITVRRDMEWVRSNFDIDASSDVVRSNRSPTRNAPRALLAPSGDADRTAEVTTNGHSAPPLRMRLRRRLKQRLHTATSESLGEARCSSASPIASSLLADLEVGHQLERAHHRRMVPRLAAVRGARVEKLLRGCRVRQ